MNMGYKNGQDSVLIQPFKIALDRYFLARPTTTKAKKAIQNMKTLDCKLAYALLAALPLHSGQ